MLSGHNSRSMLRKSVDLDPSSALLLILGRAYWCLNESPLSEEYDYVIIILIQGSTDISVFGTGRVNYRTIHVPVDNLGAICP